MQKYEITPENLNEPNKAAIATMILLSSIYKDELPSLSSQINELNMSKMDALLYCYSNHKNEIINKTATPDKNLYVKSVRNYAKQFILEQTNETAQEANAKVRKRLENMYIA